MPREARRGCLSADAARVKKSTPLTKGNISKLNELTHLSMLATGPNGRQTLDRVICVATGEALPAPKRGKTLASIGCYISRPSCSPPAAG